VPDLVRRSPALSSTERRSAEPEPARNLDLFDAQATPETERNFSAGRAVTSSQPRKLPASLEPISEEHHVVRMTVRREFVADLEKVRAALSHVVPDRCLEKVLHECIRRTLRACERRKVGSGKARTRSAPVTTAASVEEKAPASVKRTRTIPAKVRSEVWKRDGGRCTFLGEDGHRCGSNHKVEFHHIVAFARGGPSTVDNVTLYCNSHNRHAAERELGAARVALAIARRRSERGADAEMASLIG